MNRIPPVTRALLIANVAVFVLQMLTGDLLIGTFALWPTASAAVSRARRPSRSGSC